MKMKHKKSLIALFAAVLLAIPLAFAAGAPENITGLTATAINPSSIGLSWNSAKDAQGGLVQHYRIYYGVTSIQTAGEGDYDHQIDTSNNNTSYVVSGLTSGTDYYFSLTAIDSAEMESDAYSLEATATTLGAVEEAPLLKDDVLDDVSPTVTAVNTTDKIHVSVTFSEAVSLPATNPESVFSIVSQLDPAVTLAVTNAVANGDVVTLETSEQTKGTNYIITAGVAVTDLAGNPMVSGNTDSGLFAGSDVLSTPTEEGVISIAAPDETVDQIIEETSVISCGEDMDCFYENLKTCTPAAMKESNDEQDVAYSMELKGEECVLKYEVTTAANPAVTQNMACKLPMGELISRINNVLNNDAPLFRDTEEAKTLCSGTYLEAFLKTVPAPAPKDVTPPENITNLMLSFKESFEKFVVMMKWTASLNSAKDLVDQILYMSVDKGNTYDGGKSLGAAVMNHDVPDLEGGKEYTFKLTTKDASGNESTGVVKSIRLPQTGAAAGLLLLTSVLGAGHVLRRKKK